MIEMLEQSRAKVVAMRLSGKLLHRDYQEFVPLVSVGGLAAQPRVNPWRFVGKLVKCCSRFFQQVDRPFRVVRAGWVGTRLIKDHAMKSTRFGSCLLCLLAAAELSAVASPASADTTLRWKFATGQKRNYVMTQKMAMKMEVMGKQIETSVTQTVDMTWEVKAVDKDGVADMVQTIDRVKLAMMAPTGNIELDTAKAEDPVGAPAPLITLFRSMTGSPFTSKVTPRGELRDVQVPAKVVDAFKNAGPAGAMLGNEESLKNMFGQSMIVFPEAPVAEGKSWNGTRKMPMPFGTMVMDITYTLEGTTGPVENIGIDTKVKIEPKEGVPIAIAVKSQDMKGHCRFDNSDGKLNSSDVVQKLTMTVTVQGQEFAQNIETTTKMDLKKDGGAK
jgi:hypothetical protein